jgi:RNA polymerase sigma factor (TIGR02999 family)
MVWQNRAHFFGIAARVMRQVLVDYARVRQAGKRGASARKVPLSEEVKLSSDRSRELIDLDCALHKLERLDAQQSRIVELRFFGGLTVQEIAEVLGISERTVKRDWSVARAWLHAELTGRRRRNDSESVGQGQGTV